MPALYLTAASVAILVVMVSMVWLSASRRIKSLMLRLTRLEMQEEEICRQMEEVTTTQESMVVVIEKETSITMVKRDTITINNDNDLHGYRLNTFAGLPNLNFTTHVKSALSAKEAAAFDEFSTKMNAETADMMANGVIDTSRFYQLPDDFTKLRFLQADMYNVDAAVKRLRATIIFRQTSGLDDVITKPNQRLLARYNAARARRFVSFDKTGAPVIIERMGEWFSTEDLTKGLNEPEFMLCNAYALCGILDKFREAAKTGKFSYNHRFTYIGDLANVSLYRTMMNMKALMRTSSLVAAHFPELAGTVVMTNAPYVAVKAFATVRPHLDPNTAERVNLVHGNGSHLLCERCGADAIPVEWGGTLQIELPHVQRRMDDVFLAKYPYP